LVEVICDTNFLMLLVTKKIKNITNLETELGTINFVVPNIVEKELWGLSKNNGHKKDLAKATLDLIKDFKKIEISGTYADDAIISYVENNKGIIATLDTELKNKIKELGGSVISLSNNRIVLEPSKI